MHQRSSLAERLAHEIGSRVARCYRGARWRPRRHGIVDSGEERDAIRDIIQREVGSARVIDDNIEIAGAMPGDTNIGTLSESEIAGFVGADADLEDSEHLEPGDFTDDPSEASPDVAQTASLSDTGSDDPDRASSGNVVYSPPIDPVVDRRGVVGGFQSSSMSSLDVERSSDGTIGDEAIRDGVLRELREDAATNGLTVDVEVIAGVVHLTGRVDDVTDAESAEEVAARVPGVVEVVEELDVDRLS